VDVASRGQDIEKIGTGCGHGGLLIGNGFRGVKTLSRLRIDERHVTRWD
jgi:hypothetical protein